MRYYHYLSNNKIEMLYQQIAEYRPKVNTDVAIDLKVIKASRKSERSEGELSVYNKLVWWKTGSTNTNLLGT
jgi:hypothetical protein